MFTSPPLVVLTAVLAGISLYFYQKRAATRHILPLPPGPKPLPLLENIFDIPTSREYETYTRWGKEYGDVAHVAAFGKHIIILNSIKAANELLDERSAIYSDRPLVPMLYDPCLMDSGWSFIFKPYSPTWRKHRRLFAQHLNSTARAFLDRQVMSAHTLLRSMLRAPTDYVAHIRHTAANIVLGIAYGYDVKPTDDPLVDLADRMVRAVSQGVSPGGYMVNVFPWLKYLPAWFPGAGFKAFAAEARKLGKDLVQTPFETLKTSMVDGTAPPSFIRSALADLSDDSPQEHVKDILEVAATMYGAGSDTTVSCLHSCILAMVLNPLVQSRAHSELDIVLGSPNSPTFRLPTFADRPNLPYIDAILKESLRWLTVVATGVPHATIEEDEYRGWRIPKGSIVIANAWSILHDDEMYPEPFAFRPERFLDSEGNVPEPDPGITGAFGFGRRICPGRQLADASLWMEMASLLSAFTFAPANDKEGKQIDVRFAAEPAPALLLHPQPFPCTIKPRSKEAEARIRETDLNPDVL